MLGNVLRIFVFGLALVAAFGGIVARKVFQTAVLIGALLFLGYAFSLLYA